MDFFKGVINAFLITAAMLMVMMVLPGCMEIDVDTSEIDKYIMCTDDGYKYNTLTGQFLTDDQGRAITCKGAY